MSKFFKFGNWTFEILLDLPAGRQELGELGIRN